MPSFLFFFFTSLLVFPFQLVCDLVALVMSIPSQSLFFYCFTQNVCSPYFSYSSSCLVLSGHLMFRIFLKMFLWETSTMFSRLCCQSSYFTVIKKYSLYMTSANHDRYFQCCPSKMCFSLLQSVVNYQATGLYSLYVIVCHV